MGLHNLSDHFGSDARTSHFETLFNYVRTELLPTERKQRPKEVFADNDADFGNVQVEDVLDDVVGKRVLDENLGVDGNAHGELGALGGVGCVNALLHDAAAVLVTGNLVAVLHHGLVNELRV